MCPRDHHNPELVLQKTGRFYPCLCEVWRWCLYSQVSKSTFVLEDMTKSFPTLPLFSLLVEDIIWILPQVSTLPCSVKYETHHRRYFNSMAFVAVSCDVYPTLRQSVSPRAVETDLDDQEASTRRLCR